MTGVAGTTRAFFAVPLDDTLRGELAASMATLRDAPWARGVRFVAPESLHLTLRFLGDVSQAVLDAVAERVAARTPRHPAHRLDVAAIEVFPSPRRPRVISAGLAADARLARLAADVERACVATGLAPDARRFRPHITLARVRDRMAGRFAIDVAPPRAPLVVDRVVLYESDLTPSGARYTALRSAALGPPAAAGG